jgi:hypothetical protein
LSISRTKHSLSLALERSSVRSKFLTKLLHRSTQAFERSITHLAKIDNLFFDSAIIFFVPKVADKGVDLANLQCTIVQITDRGEWGKEEETFTVDASSFDNRKYRSFDLNTDAEYSLKIIPPPELRMGILEIYFDPTISTQSNMAVVNNPSDNPIDFSAVGDRPITVTSWLRPPRVNRAVGGAGNSQHLLGWAVDIQIQGYNPRTVASRLKDSWAGGLGDSAAFTHLDLRHLLGRASARWDYGNA